MDHHPLDAGEAKIRKKSREFYPHEITCICIETLESYLISISELMS